MGLGVKSTLIIMFAVGAGSLLGAGCYSQPGGSFTHLSGNDLSASGSRGAGDKSNSNGEASGCLVQCAADEIQEPSNCLCAKALKVDLLKSGVVSSELTDVSQAAKFDGLDVKFGTSGSLEIPVLKQRNKAKSIAVQPDGKILVGGESCIGPIDNPVCYTAITRYLENGGLDSSFGKDGQILRKNLMAGKYSTLSNIVIEESTPGVISSIVSTELGCDKINEKCWADTRWRNEKGEPTKTSHWQGPFDQINSARFIHYPQLVGGTINYKELLLVSGRKDSKFYAALHDFEKEEKDPNNITPAVSELKNGRSDLILSSALVGLSPEVYGVFTGGMDLSNFVGKIGREDVGAWKIPVQREYDEASTTDVIVTVDSKITTNVFGFPITITSPSPSPSPSPTVLPWNEVFDIETKPVDTGYKQGWTSSLEKLKFDGKNQMVLATQFPTAGKFEPILNVYNVNVLMNSQLTYATTLSLPMDGVNKAALTSVSQIDPTASTLELARFVAVGGAAITSPPEHDSMYLFIGNLTLDADKNIIIDTANSKVRTYAFPFSGKGSITASQISPDRKKLYVTGQQCKDKEQLECSFFTAAIDLTAGHELELLNTFGNGTGFVQSNFIDPNPTITSVKCVPGTSCAKALVAGSFFNGFEDNAFLAKIDARAGQADLTFGDKGVINFPELGVNTAITAFDFDESDKSGILAQWKTCTFFGCKVFLRQFDSTSGAGVLIPMVAELVGDGTTKISGDDLIFRNGNLYSLVTSPDSIHLVFDNSSFQNKIESSPGASLNQLSNSQGARLASQADGKTLAALTLTLSNGTQVLALQRYRADGVAPDTIFPRSAFQLKDAKGDVIPGLSAISTLEAVLSTEKVFTYIDPKDKIERATVLISRCPITDTSICNPSLKIIKLSGTELGGADTTFGEADTPGEFGYFVGEKKNISDAVRDSKGNFWIAGTSQESNQLGAFTLTSPHLLISRIKSTGELDPDYGKAGIILDPELSTSGARMLVMPDDRIVTFGAHDGNLMVLRFENP